MALTKLGIGNFPTYTCLTTDIVTNAVVGATIIGGTIFVTDNATWKIILPDLTLAPFKFPPVVQNKDKSNVQISN